MDGENETLITQDVGVDQTSRGLSGSGIPPSRPNWRALVVVGAAIAALVGAFTLGQSSSSVGADVPVVTPTAIPTAVPTVAPTATAIPDPDPQLTDLLGQGAVLAEFELGTRSRAIIWCRESVPGTQISSTLALIHVAESIRFGDQVVLYEELTKPAIPGGSQRRGPVLETEGLGGSSNFAAPLPDDEGDAEIEEASDGELCAACAPEQFTLGGGDVLIGSCVHGVPFRVGIAYVIAPPVRPGQSPLALHLSCGITTIEVQGDRIVVSGEAPTVRGLHDGRFPFPAIGFERAGGEFVASDLELLDWNCDIERSSQLADSHLLRTKPPRSISFEEVESTIGVIGIHGPMVLGLTQDQCSQLTRAWWRQPNADGSDTTEATPITDLIGLDPPAGEQDWFYSCHRD